MSIPMIRAGASAMVAAQADGSEAFVQRQFRQAGLPLIALDEPEMLVPIRSHLALYEHCARALDDPLFGLRTGSAMQVCDLGDFGTMLEAAPTLNLAIAIANNHISAYQQGTHVWLDTHGDQARWHYKIMDPMHFGRLHDAGLSLGVMFNVVRAAAGPEARPTDMRFELPDPGTGHLFEAFAGCPVQFDQPDNAVTFPARWLSLPMPRAGSTQSGDATTRLHASAAPEDLIAVSRMMIEMFLEDGEVLTIENLARSAGQEVRTLQRHLEDRGRTFKSLVAETRFERARGYLRETDMPLTEIAFRLGYSDAPNFARAFRAWTGTTPRRYASEIALG